MTAIRIIDDHVQLANIGSKTHAAIEGHIQGIGNYAFPAADGGADQILKTNGAGVLSWFGTLTDNSIADALHRHSELVASDGSPDPALSIDNDGNAEVKRDWDGLTEIRIRNYNDHASAGSRIYTSADASGFVSIFQFAFPDLSTLLPEFAGDVGFYTGSAIATTNLVIASRSADGAIKFYTGGSAAANKRLLIDKVGNVDIQGTTGALLLSRMTTTNKNDMTPVNGMIIYDLTLNKFQGRENGAWVNLI